MEEQLMKGSNSSSIVVDFMSWESLSRAKSLGSRLVEEWNLDDLRNMAGKKIGL